MVGRGSVRTRRHASSARWGSSPLDDADGCELDQDATSGSRLLLRLGGDRLLLFFSPKSDAYPLWNS
jgi:hypothetical protein